MSSVFYLYFSPFYFLYTIFYFMLFVPIFLHISFYVYLLFFYYIFCKFFLKYVVCSFFCVFWSCCFTFTSRVPFVNAPTTINVLRHFNVGMALSCCFSSVSTFFLGVLVFLLFFTHLVLLPCSVCLNIFIP